MTWCLKETEPIDSYDAYSQLYCMCAKCVHERLQERERIKKNQKDQKDQKETNTEAV
jgi:hypothetical protein